MSETSGQKKSKKSKKKLETSVGTANISTEKDIKSSVPFNSDSGKLSNFYVGDESLGNVAMAATNDNKKVVDESVGKKKKKSKKKTKEMLKETVTENKNSERLLNFSENGIQLLNHPEISVTLTDSVESKGNELKSVTDVIPPLDEEKQAVDATATASKKKKKKKKKSSNDNDKQPAVTTASVNESAVVTPTYTKVVTADNTCVLVVNNEKKSVDAKPKENPEVRKTKMSENSINFSIHPEKQFGDVLLTKKISPDTNIQFNNSISIFPVSKNTDSNSSKSQITVNLDKNTEENLSVSKSGINEGIKENLEESQPTKSQLKAERRAKQEAQRAAKLAKGSTKMDNTNNETKNVVLKEKSIPKEKSKDSASKSSEITEKSPAKLLMEKESLHRVKLFSQLPQCKQFDMNAKIHPAILEIGFQYNKGVICGSNARCVALLGALKEVIKDHTLQPGKDFCRELESSIKLYLNFLSNCRPLSVSMSNAVKFLKLEINRIPSDMEVGEVKLQLYNFINNFVKEDILIAREAIGNYASYKIVDGDVILVFAFSSLVCDVLCKAHNKKKMFRVIVVDSRPKLEGLKMLRHLVKQGLHCSYISINSVSYIMKEVSKVILGAHALLSNAYVMSRLGNKQIALVAAAYDVPVFVCCESYKFCERVLTDSFVQNELGESKDIITSPLVSNDSLKNWHDLPSLQPLNLLYDVTSPDLISEIITEKGVLPCTSVPVILRVKYGGLSQ